MIHKVIVLFIVLLSAFSTTFAQRQIMNIWSENIPGSKTNPDYVEVSDSSDNWMKTMKVTNPTIEFYPASSNDSSHTAVVICPGGAYWLLAVGHEGADVAKWFNSMGISAFVLKYRLPNDAIMEDKSIGPLQDVQEAVRIVRRNAKAWNIDPNKIGVMGFSAGGHLASTASTHFNEKVYEGSDSTSARPDFSLLIYPVISMDPSITHKGSENNLLGINPTDEQVKRFSNELQVNSETPPAFLVHSLDDGAVPVQNSINYALAMKKFKIPCEVHIFESGGHGYGMGRTNNTESTWPEACLNWMKMHGF